VKERANPGTEGNMVVGGVVYSKAEPPAPMIYKKGSIAGFEDWEPNDLVKCQVIGMGCTLIPTACFRKTYEFVKYKQCVNPRCSVSWNVEYEIKDLGEGEKWDGFELPVHKCPHCEYQLYPMWFKTVRDMDDEGVPAHQIQHL